MHRPLPLTFTIVAAAGMTVVGCEKKQQSPKAATDPQPASWLLSTEPTAARGIAEAKTTAREGDGIVLRGRIGGRTEPITNDSPVFTVIDLQLPHCGQLPGDTCNTPWDYCCETPESIVANSATIQIVDQSGNPITTDLIAQGLSALDEVIVVGMVAPRPSEMILTIQATGIYRVAE